MLGGLKIEDFVGRVGEEFRVAGARADLALVLAEVTDLSARSAPGPRRTPFSLVFRGPSAPLLSQRIWPLEHVALGRLEIFLVPIGPDGQGMRYEAVFT